MKVKTYFTHKSTHPNNMNLISTELSGLDVPGRRRQEAEAILEDRRQSLATDLDDDVNHQRQDECGAEPSDAAKTSVERVIASRRRPGYGAGPINVVKLVRCHV